MLCYPSYFFPSQKSAVRLGHANLILGVTSVLLLFIVLTCPDTAKDSKDLKVDPTGTFKKKHIYIYLYIYLESS